MHKPDPKFIKANVDAAFFEEEGLGATAVVLRNGKGQFLAAQCRFVPFVAVERLLIHLASIG